MPAMFGGLSILGMVALCLGLSDAGMWWWILWFVVFTAFDIYLTILFRRVAHVRDAHDVAQWNAMYEKYKQFDEREDNGYPKSGQ